jgi:hypothetical protein
MKKYLSKNAKELLETNQFVASLLEKNQIREATESPVNQFNKLSHQLGTLKIQDISHTFIPNNHQDYRTSNISQDGLQWILRLSNTEENGVRWEKYTHEDDIRPPLYVAKNPDVLIKKLERAFDKVGYEVKSVEPRASTSDEKQIITYQIMLKPRVFN